MNFLAFNIPWLGRKLGFHWPLLGSAIYKVTILGEFLPVGLFWRLLIFWKDKEAQRNSAIFGYFLFKQIYYTLTLIHSFKICIWRFQKWFDSDVLGFLIELCRRYFGLFWIGDCLGYFLKNWKKIANLLIALAI